METKTCKVCGRSLPLAVFRLTRWGTHADSCNECITEKRAQARCDRAKSGGITPVSDPDFDGRTIGDVWRQMCRAKKWLESRNCIIGLDGEFREVKIRKLKPE